MKSKTNKYIGYAVGLLFVAGALFLMSSGGGLFNGEGVYSASALTAEEATHDFGEILMGGGNVTHAYQVTNSGDEPVVINKVYTSCMCTTAEITDEAGEKMGSFGMPGHGPSSKTQIEVLPGESLSVEAIFDPAAHGPSGVGMADRSIYLETNSQVSPKTELKFRALVTR